jgi:hypothetical protein
MAPTGYDVFVSYAHAAQPALSEQVYRQLRTLGRRWYRLASLRLYRDTATLPATEELWPSIAAAIATSKHFLLVASPQAANSTGVQQEVDLFLSLREQAPPDRRGKLLIALVEGKIEWPDNAADFDWVQTNALPATLAGKFRAEPLHVDFTKFKPPFDRRTRRAFTEAVATLSAGFKGVTKDEVLSADRVARRRLRIAAAAAACVVAAAAGTGLYFSRAARAKEHILAAELAFRNTASNLIPQRAPRLDRVRNRPIRDVELQFDAATLPHDGSALELRITQDPLFSLPMSFYVAPFREGKTWPKELHFPEPAGTDYTNCSSAFVAGYFRWYDVARPLILTIPQQGDPYAYLSFHFDGKEFQPPGAFSLRQPFELPSLAKLLHNGATFELFRWRPGAQQPTRVDPRRTKIVLDFVAHFSDDFVLFRSRHTKAQEEVLGIGYLYKRPRIEQEALLSLYPAVGDLQKEPPFLADYRRIERGAKPHTRLERLIAATDELTNGGYLQMNGEREKARATYRHAVELLGKPEFDGSTMMIKELCVASSGMLDYLALSNQRDPRAATDAEGMVDLLRQGVRASGQPLVRRDLATTLMALGELAAKSGQRALAARSLSESVAQERAIADAVATPAAKQELRTWLREATKDATSLGLAHRLPVAEWRRRAGTA